MSDSNPLARHGGLSYLHIATRDGERTATFYEQVLGWSIERRPNGFRFASGDGLLIGGFSTDEEGGRSGFVPWFYVDGIEAAIGRVTASGGRVTEALRAEGDIRRVEVEDPAGNRLGLWEFV
jgi:predicted enzyme related to lactoylglutathione lyase